MRKYIEFLFLILVLFSCDIITEPDISDSEVIVIAPPDGLVTTASTLTFWWEHVLDAEKYNILIVSPEWDSVVTLVADTNIAGNKFLVTLPPGEYDWGISAFNNSSSTVYTISHVSIDTSTNLSSQLVVLQSPEDNYNTNELEILFSWYPVSAANSYLFDIRRDSWQGDNVIPTYLTEYDTLSLMLKDGVYYWGVQGRNDFSSTIFTTRSLIVDTEPPGRPSINYPAQNGDTLASDELRLKWSRPKISVSEIIDSVIVSHDSLFTNGNYLYFITKETELSLEGIESGKYFAKVRSYDKAGNLGEPSLVRKFYIDEE
ncbi:MAG: hypothetical protein JXA77_00420 [Bacteroidales bacterium]|nr:hypothetical protein [Bacteroidales bacterium]MBN2817637.1 hypothetical protein [Bacteroidales bacterium]